MWLHETKRKKREAEDEAKRQMDENRRKKETNLLQSYAYTSLPSFPKITNLERIDENFFDFCFHFNLTVLIKEESKTFHVTLNEGAVMKAFLSVNVSLFDIPRFSALFLLVFCKFQNNKCVIERFISMADNLDD